LHIFTARATQVRAYDRCFPNGKSASAAKAVAIHQN